MSCGEAGGFLLPHTQSIVRSYRIVERASLLIRKLQSGVPEDLDD